jgi:ADP-ribose pyrophosphatase YjhB (NUDIX family)|tara:strand:+ start:18993 stop:19553 length:561 start_codon:yes stop_codon:yes gene_type:complete
MNYCSHCGSSKLHQKQPTEDTHKRIVCDQCARVHYHNPTIICGCIIEQGDKVALCLRAIEPQKNTWTIPAGYLEFGESTEAAAQREALEETGMEVEIRELYSVFNVQHMHQVYIIYRAQFVQKNQEMGHESLAVKWFTEQTLPAEQLAYPAIKTMLLRHAKERKAGCFSLYQGDATSGRIIGLQPN